MYVYKQTQYQNLQLIKSLMNPLHVIVSFDSLHTKNKLNIKLNLHR